MNIAAISDTGRVRANNEDAYWYDTDLQAMAIADGMGGHNGGEVASYLAAHGFGLLYKSFAAQQPDSYHLKSCLVKLTTNLDRFIFETANRSADLSGMGTTIVGAAYRDKQLHLVHTGDSRAAFVSPEGQVKWLTRDDNYAQVLVDQKRLTIEQARKSPYRHRITAYIGQGVQESPRAPACHYQELDWPKNHILLLCTDGLLDDTKDSEIGHLATSVDTALANRCRHLTELANSKGGHDNCTVLLATRE